MKVAKALSDEFCVSIESPIITIIVVYSMIQYCVTFGTVKQSAVS